MTKHPREEVFAYIVAYKKQNDGVAPSVPEIAAACHMSKSTVKYHLFRLESEGKITLPLIKTTRAIQVTGALWLPPDEAAAWLASNPRPPTQ